MAHIEVNEGTPVLVHNVDGYRYSFSVEYVDTDKHEWLCEVIEYHLDSLFIRTKTKTEQEVKNNIKRALGI